MKSAVKQVTVRKRSDNIIPDYNYLFEESEEKNGKKKKSRFFRKILALNAWPLIFSSLLYLLQNSPVWILPIVTANIINIATKAVAIKAMTDVMWRNFFINVAVLVASLLLNYPTTLWRWHIISKMLRRTSAGVKSSVVRKLQSLSITYHKDMQTGKIQSKFLRDTDSVDTLLHIFVFSLIPNIIGAIISTGISVYKNGWVALFFLVVVPCNVLLTRAFGGKMRRMYRDLRIKNENMSARLATMLEMIPVTKAHGLEKKEIGTVERSIADLAASGRRVDMTTATFATWSWILNNLLSASCLIFCAVLAIKGMIGVGDIVLFQSMFTSISGSVSALINVYPQIGSGTEALNSVSEIMNSKDIEVSIGKADIPDINGGVEFKNVSYKYPDSDQYVVKDFNLNVTPGECIAVVGASGSGKSTLMNLIIGFMIPGEGDILIDGKPLREFNLSEYRHHISVVPQNSILFSGSIRQNITYGLDKYSEEELNKAVEMANLNEFVKDLPAGLDSDVGEHGDKLSGGQRQRITIARALIRNPKILILDEATSALDNISEYHVQKAIQESIKGRTTFIVAHRLSTIRNADRIVVMDGGVAVETGTYDELMAKKGKFYELKCLNDITLKQAEESLS